MPFCWGKDAKLSAVPASNSCWKLADRAVSMNHLYHNVTDGFRSRGGMQIDAQKQRSTCLKEPLQPPQFVVLLKAEPAGVSAWYVPTYSNFASVSNLERMRGLRLSERSCTGRRGAAQESETVQ